MENTIRIEIAGSFHGRGAIVRAKLVNRFEWQGREYVAVTLAPSAPARVRRELCGIQDCVCGDGIIGSPAADGVYNFLASAIR